MERFKVNQCESLDEINVSKLMVCLERWMGLTSIFTVDGGGQAAETSEKLQQFSRIFQLGGEFDRDR
jgi:hypothetical protein